MNSTANTANTATTNASAVPATAPQVSSTASQGSSTVGSELAATSTTPQFSRMTMSMQGSAAPPPTPTDYEIMTESCDWCLAETPWDDGDLFGNENDDLSDPVPLTTQATPPSKQEPPQVNLQPRQAFGIPLL